MSGLSLHSAHPVYVAGFKYTFFLAYNIAGGSVVDKYAKWNEAKQITCDYSKNSYNIVESKILAKHSTSGSVDNIQFFNAYVAWETESGCIDKNFLQSL